MLLRASPWLLLIMALASFDGAQRALSALRQAFGRFPAEVAAPLAGEDGLPAATRDVLTLVRRRGLADFRLSAALTADERVKQRTAEAAWPVPTLAASKQIFFTRSEALPAGCHDVDHAPEVTLAVCD